MRREMGSDGSWDLSLSCEKVLKIFLFLYKAKSLHSLNASLMLHAS